MLSSTSPWSSIEATANVGELRARRADATHPYDFFWALDAKGRKLFLYRGAELDTDCPFPNLKGVAVERSSDRLILRLIDGSTEDIFTALCHSLLDRTRRVMSATLVPDAVRSHLEIWQRFFGKSNAGVLTDQELRGLFGELTFLQSELIERFGQSAVLYWNGPSGSPQDFTVGTAAFEVKTRLVGGAAAVTISSAPQLWPLGGTLHLVCYGIGDASEQGHAARSPAALVDDIRACLTNAEARDAFDDRLLLAGYVDRPEYATRFFAISSATFYEVREGFPRIGAEHIPVGVRSVQYVLELQACLPFESEPDWTTMGACNGS
ncbi:PD-(D/E)XK motif protein [Cupriavidus sp. MP-37]|uniref:PD-(D/E)XK motif protein n=1 Tax=Cupriavidus sp. MP-37 TaxID=2884455 RepID=UPI001D09E717|nr:PD-(D/E)XK motif protein [Cupriavidus sp. MP-37]UDM50220.1 PD-(D/E)XK motif protein [Cupriavidus sp. MP-37]